MIIKNKLRDTCNIKMVIIRKRTYFWTYVYIAFFFLFGSRITSRSIAGDFPNILYIYVYIIHVYPRAHGKHQREKIARFRSTCAQFLVRKRGVTFSALQSVARLLLSHFARIARRNGRFEELHRPSSFAAH